jgi:glycosyltransferase involved in cell wall biosynthesis
MNFAREHGAEMKLMFAARAMNDMAGGVERMIVAIMNEMVRRGHEVALFSWDKGDARAFYDLHPAIDWFKLDMGDPALRASLHSRLRRAPRVRAIVKAFKPDVIVGFQGGPFKALLAYTLGLGIPVIAAERTAPSLYDHVGSAKSRTVEHFVFRFAKAITVQFDRYRQYYPANLQHLIVETPNPVSEATSRANPAGPGRNGRFVLLSVGRLSFQKNYSVLLKAFETLAGRFADWDLVLVGEGEERAKLEDFVRASPILGDRVHMPGATRDVASAYMSAQLFCLPSRWEGFPNALAEALAHGLPSVGFTDCAGVPDLIDPGVSGRLAPGNNNAAALADALAALMLDSQARARMGAAAAEAMTVYRPQLCFDRWEAVLTEAVRG